MLLVVGNYHSNESYNLQVYATWPSMKYLEHYFQKIVNFFEIITHFGLHIFG